ncbi:hypothetical protein [Bacillus nitroreducens]
MNRTRFFIYQILLFTALLLLNLFADSYISRPFSRVDLLAICITVPLAIVIVGLVIQLYKRFNMRMRQKVLFLVMAFILAIIIITVIENIWFYINGEMIFTI